MGDMKTCNRCLAERDDSSFHKDKASADGLYSICKDCKKDYMDAHTALPEVQAKREQTSRDWYSANQEYAVDKAKTYYAQNKDASLRNRLKRRYGLTVEAYDALCEAQGGVCKLCGGTNGDGTALCVDHEHVPGYEDLPAEEKVKYVRGLLCRKHNSALGVFRDNPDLLAKAVEYLRATRPSS